MKRACMFLIFIFFVLTSLYITYPLILNPTTLIPNHLGDELFMTWTLNWNIHALTTDVSNIFNANIYYPFKNTLAYSDALFSSSLLALPVHFLSGGEPMAAYSFTLISTLALLGFCMYLLVYDLTKNHFAAIISGTVVAFSPYVTVKTMHLQVITTYWIPLCFLFLFRYFKTGRFRWIAFSAACFLLQTANSFLPGYFIVISSSTILIYLFFTNRSLLKKRLNKKVFVLAGFSLGAVLLLAIPYYQVSREFHVRRDIRESIHLANRPEYFFAANDRSRLKPLMDSIFYKNDTGPFGYDGWLGIGIVGLGIAALLWRFFIVKKPPHLYFDAFACIALLSFVLSLGPAIQWGGHVIKKPFIIPLPYAILYYLAPGFQGFRNSARWEMMSVIAVGVIVGLMMDKLLKKRSLKWQIVCTFIICFAALAEFNPPYSYTRIESKKELPPVYRFLNSRPKNASLVELPMYAWYMHPFASDEHKRVYYSAFHFRKIMNGTSGFSPPAQHKAAELLITEFPSKKSIAYLKSIGLDYVVLHKKDYERLQKAGFTTAGKQVMTWSSIQKKLADYPELTLVKQFGGDTIFKLN